MGPFVTPPAVLGIIYKALFNYQHKIFCFGCMNWPRDERGRFVKRLELKLAEIESSSSSSSNTMSQHEDNHVRSLKDYLHPTCTTTPSCIMFPPNAPHLDFKPGMIQLLPTFHGLDNENPYVHIWEFEEVVDTFHSQPNVIDSVRLKFFPFSLKDRAKN